MNCLRQCAGVTDESERATLAALVRDANSPGWWHKYGDVLPSWLESYIGLEAAAAQIWVYEVQFVPDLLQTGDYARGITVLSHDGVTTKEVERRVQLRMARQEMLDQPNPPILRVVLDEAALWRNIGGPKVMREQLKHLTEMAESPNVTIQVLPFHASNRSVERTFTILRFAEPDLPDVVYLEQLTSALYLDNPSDIKSYLRAMQRLDTEALPASDTTKYLQALIKQIL